MSWADRAREYRRHLILYILEGQSGRSANDSVLRSALDALAVVVSRDVVTGDLAWLAEQGLVTTEGVDEFTVATLTSRGSDVAQDRAQHPGVARPEA